jgi:hypothetical protein
MIFKPLTWYRIAVGLAALNVMGGAFALGASESTHAAVHGFFAVVFGLWAARAHRSASTGEPRLDTGEQDDRLDVLTSEIDSLRQQLTETQERLDFAERMLARGQQPRPVDPQR